MVERVDSLPDELTGSGVALGVHLETPAGIDPGRGEVEAQSLRLERLARRRPDYIDGHHHCHARPRTAEAVAEFAAAAGMAVRSVDAEHRRLLRAAGVRTPERLIGRYAESEPVRPAELDALPAGWTEWMVHPGHAAGFGGSDYDAGREEDLELLLGLELPGSRHSPRPALASEVARSPVGFAVAGLLRRRRRRDDLGEARLERLGEVVQHRHRLVVADQAEVDAAVVAHDPDADGLALGQRDHREDVAEAAAEHVERELRARARW